LYIFKRPQGCAQKMVKAFLSQVKAVSGILNWRNERHASALVCKKRNSRDFTAPREKQVSWNPTWDKLKPSGKLRFAARSRRQQGDNSRSAPIRRRSLPFIFIAFRFSSAQLTARISSSRGRINLHLAAYRVIAVSRIAKANGLQSAENVTDPNVRIPPAALINGEKCLIAQSVAMEV